MVAQESCKFAWRMRTSRILLLALVLGAGCQTKIINSTDKQVYQVIAERQRDALGATTNVDIGEETGVIGAADQMYDFAPHPTTLEIPAEFKPKATSAPSHQGAAQKQVQQDNEAGSETLKSGDSETRIHAQTDPSVDEEPTSRPSNPSPGSQAGTPSNQPDTLPGEAASPPVAGAPGSNTDAPPDMLSPDIFTPEQRPNVQTFGLAEALEYAQRHGREVQDAKELLYLEALDLTLERHLWTPQWVAGIQSEFADYGQIRDFDRAMTAVADVAVAQKLPYGGDVTARMVGTLMRDLGAHTTSGESGNFILEANIPLFRGAGRVAYESRYQAERDLIYAVRTYERFRRAFIVDVASEYFNIQLLKSAVANTYKSYENRYLDWEKADFTNRVGQSKSIFEAPRALSSFRQAESALVRAKEAYEASLDRFKIFIGMPVPDLLDVQDQEKDAAAQALDALLPEVAIAEAVEVALRYRLDLLNTADQIDDARRGVLVAKNQILPDLNATGSVALDTDPEQLNSTSYNTERATWRALVQLRMDDRKRERNAYRASLVAMRKSERDYEVAADTVRADVRRAARRVLQQAKLRDIQIANIEENELRLEAARAQFGLGKITNQDVVDAETDLLSARNELAAAISAYRIAILEFRRDTETLRVDENGHWMSN